MPITRDDIEAKAMQIAGAVEDTQQSAKDKAMWGVALAAGVVAAAFILGRKRGSRNKTLVEVYRV